MFGEHIGTKERAERCYHIDWNNKLCYYSNDNHYKREGYKIVEPIFDFDEYGTVVIKEE